MALISYNYDLFVENVLGLLGVKIFDAVMEACIKILYFILYILILLYSNDLLISFNIF